MIPLASRVKLFKMNQRIFLLPSKNASQQKILNVLKNCTFFDHILFSKVKITNAFVQYLNFFQKWDQWSILDKKSKVWYLVYAV